MLVRLINIQGFRGEFNYTIDDVITIINSKHNGVGKTTLYDCIKFLVDMESVDKEERHFFRNLEEDFALFSIQIDDLELGFAIRTDGVIEFFRREGDEMLVQNTNFPTAGQDIGILVVNGVLLNIFDKEVNLFSKSKLTDNYSIVKEMTTHKPTEDMLVLMQNSIEFNERDAKHIHQELYDLNVQVARGKYYTELDAMNALLNNNNYLGLEYFLNDLTEGLSNIRVIKKGKFNSFNLVMLEDLVELTNKLIPTDLPVISGDAFLAIDEACMRLKSLRDVKIPITFNTEALDTIDDLATALERLEPSYPEVSFNIDVLELMDDVCDVMDKVNAVPEPLNLNIDILEMMDNLCEDLTKLEPVEVINFNKELLYNLTEFTKGIAMVRINHDAALQASRASQRLRDSLAKDRIQCPIRQEVYLINGECQY